MAQSSYRKLTAAETRRLYPALKNPERYVRKGATVAQKNTISRRQFDQLSDRYEAWGGRARFERRYQMPSYRFFAEKITGAPAKSFQSPTDKKLQKAYRAAAVKKKGGRVARNPRGYLADFLVDIGLREDDWTFDVGDTPPGYGS